MDWERGVKFLSRGNSHQQNGHSNTIAETLPSRCRTELAPVITLHYSRFKYIRIVYVEKRRFMNPATINTILNTAPMVLQGASKLIRMIQERGAETGAEESSAPATMEGLKREIEQIHTRLNANDESDVEQIQLIEQLARQNEAMAESLRKALHRITLLGIISLIAFIIAAVSLIVLMLQ